MVNMTTKKENVGGEAPPREEELTPEEQAALDTMMDNYMMEKVPEDYEGAPPTEEETSFFENQGLKPFIRCVGCEEYLIDIHREYPGSYVLEEGFYSDKKDGYVCGACREGDDYHPCGTVVIYNPAEGTAEKYVVGEYSDMCWEGPEGLDAGDLENLDFDYYDNLESPIQFSYSRTDAWRGHYNPVVPEGWRHFHEDCVLAWSRDAEALKDFDTDVKAMLWEAGVRFAVCFGTTSNLFSAGYDILVEASDDELKNLAMVVGLNQLKILHRDPDRFRRTALTGSDEDTREARLLVKAYDMLSEGTSFEDVKDEILAEAMSDE